MSEQLVLDLGRHDDGHFVAGLANQKARDALMSTKMGLILGEARAGKTGLCDYAQKIFGAEILSESRAVEAFIETGQRRDILIDDVDMFVQKDGAESALFHLYNHAKSQDLRLIMFVKSPPSKWGMNLPDLRSRIESLPITEIEAPDDAMILELLANGFHARGVLVSHELLEYISKRVERSYVQIEHAINTLDLMAQSEKAKVSRKLAARYFGDGNE